MRNPVDYAISHARLTIAILVFLLLAGFVAYVTIPKEAEPDVTIPIVYVNVLQRGISPEDAERLILKPLETSLKSVANVKEMRSAAFEGGGYVLLEFEAGFDPDTALADVRAKVDDAKSDLPSDADEPIVQEVNLSLFPVLVVALGGDVPERTLLAARAPDADRDRAGSGRPFGRSQGRPRRGGGDHHRADAPEELQHPDRPARYRLQAVEQPCRRRRAGKRHRSFRRQGTVADRDTRRHPELSDRRLRRRRGASRRRRRGAPDLQGPDLDHARQRQAGDHHRSGEARRRQPDRDRRRDAQGRGVAEGELAEHGARDLHAGQVERHPHHAARIAEQRDHRRPARRHHHAERARHARVAVHRHRHSGVVPDRHSRPLARRAHRQHRGALLADPRRRHAGRRRDHRLGVRRAAHVGGDGAARSLFACREAHGGTGHCCDARPASPPSRRSSSGRGSSASS